MSGEELFPRGKVSAPPRPSGTEGKATRGRYFADAAQDRLFGTKPAASGKRERSASGPRAKGGDSDKPHRKSSSGPADSADRYAHELSARVSVGPLSQPARRGAGE